MDKVAERVGRARISVAMPPLEGLWPGSESPFCALAVAGDGGIDHGVSHVGLVRAGLRKPHEHVSLVPITVLLEDGVPVAEEGGKCNRPIVTAEISP